jgi:tetratricopeptide (TPR) repeat protein
MGNMKIRRIPMRKFIFASLLLSILCFPAYGKLDKLSYKLMKYTHTFAPDMKEQIESLNEKITDDPNDPTHRFNRALAYYLYFKNQPLHGEPVGRRAFAKDWNIIAFSDVNKAIEVSPDFAEAYWLRGKLWSCFSYDEVPRLNDKIEIKKDVDYYDIREQNELNDYLTSLKINDKFIEVYISLFEFFSSFELYSDTNDANVFEYLEIANDLGLIESAFQSSCANDVNAFEYIETAIDLGSAQAAYQRSWYHFHKEEYREGLKWISKAIELDPNHIGYFTRRAEFYYRAGDYDSAIDDIMHSVYIDDPNNYNIPKKEIREIFHEFIQVGKPPVNYIKIISRKEVEIDFGVFGINKFFFKKVDNKWIEDKSKRHRIMF